ncbi:cupin-like domain-containing protein [Flavobacterium hungaricum]|uniref:Cupin-like domain-containing protein n=1 Tax=Flavobacterium hungaricum TaxID=2082725 RepID=A0ABR9TGM4_9FLAO|nr:cupin-like domain-containing protein [Flavobacterium hungaricum]MBE8724520.1 cupin-like domain-containing protein [Flavobacterium hungaricum]
MTVKTIELIRVGDYVVEKKHGMTYNEFSKNHLFANYPVVIGDACEGWNAKEKFSLEFFRSTYGDREVSVEGQKFKLKDYIDLMETSTVENPAPYPCKLQMDTDYPELIPDVSPRFKYSLPDWTHSKLISKRFTGTAQTLEIFFGSPGGVFPYVHYDYLCLHAFITQLHGVKEFTVIPPSQTPYIYQKKDNLWVSEIPDLKNIDFEKYPLSTNLTPITFTVGPGETLFIPCGWWHTAHSLTETISIAQDCLNTSNLSKFKKEVFINLKKKKSIKTELAKVYLSTMISTIRVLDFFGIKKNFKG